MQSLLNTCFFYLLMKYRVLKHKTTNIRKIDNALGRIRSLEGVFYDWTDDFLQNKPTLNKQDTGLIAQEVQKVLPEVVFTIEGDRLAIRYEKLAGLIIQAINDLAAEVDEIKKKLP